MTNPTTSIPNTFQAVRVATAEECKLHARWQAQQKSRDKVLAFVAEYYGTEKPDHVVVKQDQYYNDEYNLDQIGEVFVYDKDDKLVAPDFSLPAWNGTTADDVLDEYGEGSGADESSTDELATAAEAWLYNKVYGRHGDQAWDLLVPFTYSVQDYGDTVADEDIELTFYIHDALKGAPATLYVLI